jgi:hypothetical protein
LRTVQHLYWAIRKSPAYDSKASLSYPGQGLYDVPFVAQSFHSIAQGLAPLCPRGKRRATRASDTPRDGYAEVLAIIKQPKRTLVEGADLLVLSREDREYFTRPAGQLQQAPLRSRLILGLCGVLATQARRAPEV